MSLHVQPREIVVVVPAHDERDRLPACLAGLSVAAARVSVPVTAARFDSDPFDRTHAVELLARRARAVVETAVEEAISRTGRALGPGPLVQDAAHARRVADLSIYVRQSHAERDLAALGRLAGTAT